MVIYKTQHCIVGIETSWSEGIWCWVKGWLISKINLPQKIHLSMPHAELHEISWYERSDIQEIASEFAEYFIPEHCGFTAWFKRPYAAPLIINLEHNNQIDSSQIFLNFSKDQSCPDQSETNLFDQFIEIVNQGRLDILEIGSRIVSPGSQSKRTRFPNARSYVGFDYYKDANTDQTGDAHQLSRYFQKQNFDAVFSISVLEHLAMPWKVALEINKILKPGGITFHSTHFAWPPHETPWDFWRFSEEGLKVLFSEAVGFQVLKTQLFSPGRIYMENPSEDWVMPIHRSFGGVAVLAQKFREYDSTNFCWNTNLIEVLGEASNYPSPDNTSPINSNSSDQDNVIIF